MSNVTTEQKIRLIQQIRSRYREDRYDMYNRERILYGKAAQPPEPDFPEEPTGGPGGMEYPERVSGFRVRLFLAAFLFAALVVMDVNEIRIGGITAQKVMEVIAVDYEEKIDEWVEALSRSAP